MLIARLRSTNAERREIDVLAPNSEKSILWYEFDAEVALPSASSGLDAAAVALLPYAMTRGMDLHLEGVVERSLLANLEEYQDAWSLWRPDLVDERREAVDAVGDLGCGGLHVIVPFAGWVTAT